MISVSQLWKYPFKSGKGQQLQSTQFDNEGMVDDRRLVAIDKNGLFVTARKHSQLLKMSCTQNEQGWLLEHSSTNETVQIDRASLSEQIEGVLWKDNIQGLDAGDEAAAWLSEAIGLDVRIAVWHKASRFSNKYQFETSFSDASPILVTSEASIEKACEWAGIETETRRYRPNIVVDGVDAFAEDNWRSLKIGNAEFEVLDTCVRCVLTTIDPDTTERHPGREPMLSLMKNHSTEDGQPLFGINVKLLGSPEDVSISCGDEVEVST